VTIKQLVFYNAGHNGDIFYSTEFVNELKNFFNVPTTYCHDATLKEKLLINMPDINYDTYLHKFSFLKDEYEYYYHTDSETLFINTWIGSSHFGWIPPNIAVSLDASYSKYSNLYNHFKIPIKNIKEYIPKINFSLFDINNVDKFNNEIILKFKKWILVCNGPVLSGQSNNFSFTSIIDNLSSKFSNVGFILTDQQERLSKNNIFYTDDITGLKNKDLFEIAYLSTKVDIIVGRASGPYCITHNLKNLTDSTKTFIAISNYLGDSIWAKPEEIGEKGAKQIWTNNYDLNYIENILEKNLEGQL